ncbi:hypothetical protein B0H10DRAFT_1865550 [Mycena sp. CBHHK59/15]|nr:hypothetical protein B0H10DRAFT_1865550 [Mycena sp. CBHHK59/15]
MPRSFDNTINNDQATFLGFALEAISYGTYLVLFGISIAVLIRRTPAMNASKTPMFAVTCFMFSLCTVHFGLNFNNVYNGLMVHPRPHISEETHLLAGADMLFSITDFCSQLILIYRCYLVWGKTIWIIILPLLMSLATVGCGVGLIGLVLSINPTAPQAPAAIVPVGTAGFSMSLCLNFIVSALIVGRIWYISRTNRLQGVSHSDGSIQRAIGIIIESGLLFLVAQFVFVVLFSISHPAQAVVEPVATQIYGISPTLIIVRVGMGASYEQTSVVTPTQRSSLRFVSFSRHPAMTSHATTSHGTRTEDLEMSRSKKNGSTVSVAIRET